MRGMKMSQDQTTEVDFEIRQEDWTRYKLLTDDGILRVRIAIMKIMRTGTSEVGTPNFGVAAQNLLSVLLPETLLRKEGEVPVQSLPPRPDEIKEGTDIDFESIDVPKWQEYKTKDGWIVMIRPEIGKVIRLKGYLPVGQTHMMEPVYWANVQPVYRIKEAKEKPK
jgi:hypothetical protein